MKQHFAIALLFVAAFALPAQAQSDLDRIPQAANAPPPVPTSSANRVVYVQSDLTLNAVRGSLAVPLPPPAPPAWEARLFVDARLNWQIGDNLSLAYSGRLNLRAGDSLAFPSRESVRHDFREAYLTWQRGDWFVQVGRINLKSGVGLGFNPTDYFKTRAVVDPESADPTVLREDRLGTVMATVQTLWSGGSFTVAVAPELAHETPPYLSTNLPTFDPGFDRTNARWRMLAKASLDLPASPEFLIYREQGNTQFGLNLSKGVGQSVVTYVEWSGGRSQPLVARAFKDGFETGVLPWPAPMPVDGRKAFRNDLAAGFSYATDIGFDLDFEYDYHRTGLSGTDWRNWFATGGDPRFAGEMWFIRGYAADVQEPVARSSIFLRADWRNAFVRDLSLSGFVDADTRDGSGLVQFAADYDLSSRWTAGALVDVYYGRVRSDFGSLPKSASVLVKLSRYF